MTEIVIKFGTFVFYTNIYEKYCLNSADDNV